MVCNIMLNPNPKSKDEKRNKSSPPSSILTLQDFFFRETNFYFCQFLSNFLKYSFPNISSSHLYNIFIVYFPGNSPLLKSCSFTKLNFSSLLTSVFILLSNSVITSFAFSKSSSLFYLIFFPPPILQLHPFLLVSLHSLSVFSSILYTTLLD